jgi:hypothetical protein
MRRLLLLLPALALFACPPPPPSLEGLEVAIAPTSPQPGQALAAMVVVDAYGSFEDEFTYRYEWMVDGAPVALLSGSRVDAGETVAGQTWEVRVTPELIDGPDVLAGPAATARVSIVAAPVLDGDGDGFEGPFGDGVDCDDADSTIHPIAAEACDGIDRDCNGIVDDTADLDFDGVYDCEDCDDDDPANFPGNVEVCDVADNDCNNLIDDGVPDIDGDGSDTCNDCDDTDPDRFPGNVEVCEQGFIGDQVDQDCLATNDTTGMGYWHYDLDGDGLGQDPPALYCGSAPEGWVPLGGDCDNDDDTVYPGAPELCDDQDNNCDGMLAGFETDDDGDGQTECDGDCADDDPEIWLGAYEQCNGLDDNCDGLAEPLIDTDGDGAATCDGDCDDYDAANFPGNPEVCDSQDNDCDSDVDEGLLFLDWFLDADFDGFGAGAAASTCDGAPPDHVAMAGDCDDVDPANFPSNLEICDGQDNDCGGDVDEGFDLDADGWTICAGDCDDDDDTIHPDAEEVCNGGVDDDCDPAFDENGDEDGDGWSICDGDCDDDSATVYPDAPENGMNNVDDDCDGVVDEYTWTYFYSVYWMNECDECHYDEIEGGGFWAVGQQEVYDAMVGVPSIQVPSMNLVEPGDSTISYLQHKLDATFLGVGGSGENMPRELRLLNAVVRDRLRDWIDRGAPYD